MVNNDIMKRMIEDAYDRVEQMDGNEVGGDSYLSLGHGGGFDGAKCLVNYIHKHLFRRRMRSHMSTATAGAVLSFVIAVICGRRGRGEFDIDESRVQRCVQCTSIGVSSHLAQP